MLRIALLLGFVALASCSSAKPAAEDPALAEGRALTTAFYDGHLDELWTRFGPGLRKLNGDDEAKLAAFRTSALTQLGARGETVHEELTHEGGVTTYVQTARFAKIGMPIDTRLGVDAHGTIVSFSVSPKKDASLTAAPTANEHYETHATLRLPFDGAWTVAWGGRTIAQNQHVVARDQRFAYDFLVVENGATHRGDGARNEDYFAYGRPILAPADGVVVSVVNDVAENRPGHFDTQSLAGNHVMVDHGNGEYSLLAHLIPGSVSVKAGERVTSGQVIGRCGNSGHSSEPHLHYHLQDSPRLSDAAGLPAPFVRFEKDGAIVARGEPVRGERIIAR